MGFLDNKYIKSLLPAICALITGICGNAVFSINHIWWKAVCIILLALFSIFDIILIIRYTKSDEEIYEKINKLQTEIVDKDKKIKILTEHANGFKKAFNEFEKCFDENATKVYDLVKNARNKQIIDLKIWNFKNICDFACTSLYNLLVALSEKGKEFSVSVIVEREAGGRKKQKKLLMLSYDGYNKTKPHIFNSPITISSAKKYFYGKLFESKNPEVTVLMNSTEVDSKFFFKDSLKRGKYSQYIGIPIFCDGNKMIGLLQIVSHNNSIISSDEKEMWEIINSYCIAYSNFILFAEKVEKGIALEFNK